MKTQYMAVTSDAYELPLAVADSVCELARCTGHSRSTIYRSIGRADSGKRTGVKFVRIEHEPPHNRHAPKYKTSHDRKQAEPDSPPKQAGFDYRKFLVQAKGWYA